MKLLVVGHSLIIDSNRKFWGKFAQANNAEVDLIAPSRWCSNLSKEIHFKNNPSTDSGLRSIFNIDVCFKGKGSFFFFSLSKIFRLLSLEKYNAIYLNQETWSNAACLFLLVKFFTKNKSTKVFLCVAQNLKKKNLAFLHPYERFISKGIHAFLHCSQEVEEVLRWKGIKKPSLYFPLPFDDEVYQFQTSGNTRFSLGFLGRLSEDKGLPLLLRALDDLNSNEIIYPLIVGGSGPLQAELTSRKYVTYLGVIPHNEAYKFYQSIDCFILPSQTCSHWKEQFGRVITESFGAGKPVIGSSSGSIPEVLGKLSWEWVFKEDSVEELKYLIVKLKKFLDSDEGQMKLSDSIQKNQKNFSNSEVALKLYQQMLSSF